MYALNMQSNQANKSALNNFFLFSPLVLNAEHNILAVILKC